MPVTVKMRRGLKNGSRAALDLGPRLEDLGVAALTLHPRSAQQMYTGFADHTLTAELVDLVSVPVSPPATSSTGTRPSGCSPTPAPPR